MFTKLYIPVYWYTQNPILIVSWYWIKIMISYHTLLELHLCSNFPIHLHQCFDKLIWHTIGPKIFLFGTAQFSLWASGAVNYDYIVTNSIKSSLIGSRCIPNGAHTNHFWANLAHASKLIKNSDLHVHVYFIIKIAYIVYSDPIWYYCVCEI